MHFELISDLHKDAYGFRPSSAYMRRFNAMAQAEQQAEWDSLCETLAANERRKAEIMTANAERFEALVADTIAMGAGDRATAIRWILEGEGLTADADWYGMEYAAFTFGLPFNYFEQQEAA